MGEITCKLTVCFEPPFWIGVFERCEDGKRAIAKVTFGAEPKDPSLYAYILTHYFHLEFAPTAEKDIKAYSSNPKKRQREIHKQLSEKAIGTKSQQALKLQQEQRKQERKAHSRTQKEEASERKYLLKQQKKKEKHRGR